MTSEAFVEVRVKRYNHGTIFMATLVKEAAVLRSRQTRQGCFWPPWSPPSSPLLLARHWIHSEMKYIELQKAAFATYVYID